MGTSSFTYSFPARSLISVAAKIAQLKSDHEAEYGHGEGYSGGINSCDSLEYNERFALSSKEVRALIKKHGASLEYEIENIIAAKGMAPDKRDIVCYKIGDFDHKLFCASADKKTQGLLDTVSATALALLGFERDIFSRAVNAKSKTRGCKCCGASYPVDRLAKKHASALKMVSGATDGLSFRSSGRIGYERAMARETDQEAVARVEFSLYETAIGMASGLKESKLLRDAAQSLSAQSSSRSFRKPWEDRPLVDNSFLKCLLCNEDMFTTASDTERRERLLKKLASDICAYTAAKKKYLDSLAKKYPAEENFWLVLACAPC